MSDPSSVPLQRDYGGWKRIKFSLGDPIGGRVFQPCRHTLDEFDKIIELNRLKLFHINDSKKGLGSRVDRHEHPGGYKKKEEIIR